MPQSILHFVTRHSPQSLAALALCWGANVGAQTPAPIRTLELPQIRSTRAFGSIYNVRELSDGRVLINDGLRRQLVILDENLGTSSVVLDSAGMGSNSYGPRTSPMFPYLADSTLFVDRESMSLLLLDPQGKVVRTMSVPRASDLTLMGVTGAGWSGTDQKGNLIYRTAQRQTIISGGPTQANMVSQLADSAAIVRANLDSRIIDTIARVRVTGGGRRSMQRSPEGRVTTTVTVNPLVALDDWGVLSDGTIAIVRGGDYHLEIISPTGVRMSTPKVPFPWKRLSDEEKESIAKHGGNAVNQALATRAGSPASDGTAAVTTRIEVVPAKELADYQPALRNGGVKADLEEGLWVLTSASTNAGTNELVYDVFNNRGELRERVRVAAQYTIAGFGRSGAIYLMRKDSTNAWYLERSRVDRK